MTNDTDDLNKGERVREHRDGGEVIPYMPTSNPLKPKQTHHASI